MDADVAGEHEAVTLALALLAAAAPSTRKTTDLLVGRSPAVAEFVRAYLEAPTTTTAERSAQLASMATSAAERRTLGILALLCTCFDPAMTFFEALPPRLQGDPVADVLLAAPTRRRSRRPYQRARASGRTAPPTRTGTRRASSSRR